MDFENTFEVPLPPDRAWAVLLDVPNMVDCMPGAELVEIVDDTTFKGKVTVRLGPVTMNFSGTVKFTEMDAVKHRAVANARGNDAKGRGAATANIRFGLDPSPTGSLVTINTALSLTGAVAQYGRASGVIKELANQITSEFARRLRTKIDSESLALERADGPVAPLASAPAIERPVEGLSAGKLLWNVFLAYLSRLLGHRRE
ncbi:MAG: SRPBCC family protein [Rhodospirillales bacterium]|jgi:carbon monoxide dehydrogenase subunit G